VRRARPLVRWGMDTTTKKELRKFKKYVATLDKPARVKLRKQIEADQRNFWAIQVKYHRAELRKALKNLKEITQVMKRAISAAAKVRRAK
jgi:hypothetical protein